MMTSIALVLLATPVAIAGYAYVGYPLLLAGFGAMRRRRRAPADPAEWPTVTITVPVYNEARVIRTKLEALLALDYPADRRHILVISDASTDGTDDIVREFADRGVELLRLPVRGGKSAAENAAASALRGEIVVNSDATVHVPPHALKPLIRAFQDPEIGVASGRDVSVSAAQRDANGGESGYVGYEMWVRSLETRCGSIVGASGCFYGIRARIYDGRFPEQLSRDFASAIMARRAGTRAVSVDEAVCYVPRTTSLQAEYRRKVRTMARGLNTLWHMREFMNPLRYGSFALMLISHKLCRWLVYLTLPLAALGLVLLAVAMPAGRWALLAAIPAAVVGVAVVRWPDAHRLPRIVTIPGFLVASNIAGLEAWAQLFRGTRHAVWEPTRRAI